MAAEKLGHQPVGIEISNIQAPAPPIPRPGRRGVPSPDIQPRRRRTVGLTELVVGAGVVATAGVAAAVGVNFLRQQGQNPDQTPLPGGIVTPGETPTPLPTTGTIEVTPSPKTPSPTPEATPTPIPTENVQNMTFKEIVLNDAEFTQNGEIISSNERLSYSYSQKVLDSADVSKITVDKEALDNVFSITRNTMYKVAGLKTGTNIELAGRKIIQKEPATTPKIEGKVNKINVYIVSENELEQIQTDLENSKLKYATFNDWPDLVKLMGIMHFEKNGTLVAILSSQKRYTGESLAGTPDSWNKTNVDYRVTFDGPGSAFFMLTVGAQIGQGKSVNSPLSDPVYRALGCSESNDFCRISGTTKIEVTFQN